MTKPNTGEWSPIDGDTPHPSGWDSARQNADAFTFRLRCSKCGAESEEHNPYSELEIHDCYLQREWTP